jgi:hypothetical protein
MREANEMQVVVHILLAGKKEKRFSMACLWYRGVRITFLLSEIKEGSRGQFFIKLTEIE